MKFRFKFWPTPVEVAARKDLSGDAKLVLAILVARANGKGFAWPSQQNIADAAGCDIRTVRRHLEKLESVGLLAKNQRGLRKSNMYEIKLTGQNDLSEIKLTGQNAPSRPVNSVRSRPVNSVRSHRKRTLEKNKGTVCDAVADRIADPVEKGVDNGDKSTKPDKKPKADPNEPMDVAAFVAWCDASPHRHINLIGAWAEASRPALTTRGQWQAFIRRNVRAAKEMEPFSDEQIAVAYQKIRESKWLAKATMETIIKFLV